MSRVLLDESIPDGLRLMLPAHDVEHATRLRWDGLRNGELIAAAEQAGYDVMITADKNLRYQQNLRTRRLAIVVLGTNHWPSIRSQAERVREAVDRAAPGTFLEIELGRSL